jgi:hypothetical protein
MKTTITTTTRTAKALRSAAAFIEAEKPVSEDNRKYIHELRRIAAEVESQTKDSE